MGFVSFFLFLSFLFLLVRVVSTFVLGGLERELTCRKPVK